MGECQPCTLGECQPCTLGECQPCTLGECQPCTLGKCQPCTLGECQPCTLGECQPCTLGECQPCTLGECQPCTLGECQPCTLGECQPCTLGECQPCTLGECQPCTLGECQPFTLGECQPCVCVYLGGVSVILGECQPCTLGECQPCTLGECQPCNLGECQPCVCVYLGGVSVILGECQPACVCLYVFVTSFAILFVCRYELSVAYTMPATPRCSVGAGYSSGGTGMVRNRSLRGNVIRNGDGVGVKGLSLPGSTATRTSSTLPRMSARQLQLPIPHATPSFLRPTSAFIPSAAPPIPSHTHLHGLSHQVQVFQSPHTSAVTQLSSPATATTASTPFLGSSGVPPPLPPRTYEMSETYMDDLCKSITDHVLPDGMPSNILI